MSLLALLVLLLLVVVLELVATKVLVEWARSRSRSGTFPHVRVRAAHLRIPRYRSAPRSLGERYFRFHPQSILSPSAYTTDGSY